MYKPGRNKPCPCGSGKKFKHCCIGKNFTFLEEGEGHLTMEMPLSEDAKGVLDRCEQDFVRHFEREPGEGDPIFLGKYLYSEQDLERETVKAMEVAGIAPELIYAYKKTGFLQREDTLDGYTGAAIQEWDNAIDEFELHGGADDDTPEGKEFDETLSLLEEEFESYIFALGLANDKFFNLVELDQSTLLGVVPYQALCASRVHRAMRSVRVLIEHRYSEDVLKIARTIYESYLHMVAVQHISGAIETFVDGPLGIRRGTHAYKTNRDGSTNKRVIVALNSGREIAAHISAYKMAAASPCKEEVSFFDLFYPTTSQMIHPSVFALDGYVSSRGLDPVKPHMHKESIVFTSLVVCMVLDQISQVSGCPDQTSEDCRIVVTRSKKLMLRLLDLLDVWRNSLGSDSTEIDVVRSRCARLADG